MKVVISTFGSSGDFNPCLGLGRALRQKGVDVLFLSNPFYERKITVAGLRFIPAGEYFDVFEEIRGHPDYLHPRKGPPAVWKMVLNTVPVMYRAMNELIAKESPDMIACHLLEYGGMIAAMNAGVPYTTLSPTPMGWCYKPSLAYVNYIRLPRWIRSLQARAGRRIFNMAFKYSLKPYCNKRSIPGCPDSLITIYENARLNLGLWSQLFRDETVNDPPHSKICGFARDEHIRDWPDVPEQIIRLFDNPKPPVVVGLGSTASLHGTIIYKNTARACRTLNRPCLLVGSDLTSLADPQHNILAVDFAPYGWVFPRAGLVIHHGGVNTTAETLRAGIPALVIPHGYDQFDNAMRTQQMGVSIRLRMRQVLSINFISTVQYILNNPQMQNRAKAFSERLQAEPDGGIIAAAEIITAIEQG